MKRFVLFILVLLLVLITNTLPTWAIGEERKSGDIPDADIRNDEGGPVVIHGELAYTDPFFPIGVSDPLIILEDQTGFVNRNKKYLIPVASQQLGQITSDFFDSPFTYSLSLPIAPQAPLNDVDHDDREDVGVMVFQIAYWTNTFGDAFLEERDLFGGGWSSAYASAEISNKVETQGEYIGGKIIIYAPEKGQAFPSGFGDDEKLFTADDPLVVVPQGYTVVDMNNRVFRFDRSREPKIDLIEGEGAEADDFSEMPYTEAFDAMVEKMRLEYAFTEFKDVDWDALYDEFYPRIEEAEDNEDSGLFSMALQEFVWRIPDGHVSMAPLSRATYERFVYATDGGLGMALRQLDDGRVLVTHLTEGAAAESAGIELRAEIISINDKPIEQALDETRPWSAPFSTGHVARLQQLRYLTRYPIGSELEVTFQNPDSSSQQSVILTATSEVESFSFSSFNITSTGYEYPIEVEVLGPYLLVSITSFFDDARLTIQLWERVLSQANTAEVPGIIIDMRNNGGGIGYLADQMAAYFFDESFNLGNKGRYDQDEGGFYFDPTQTETFFLPSEELRYSGEIVVLVGPNCASACEFFSYNMTINDRATIIGQYPTAGLGGGVEQFFMPEGIRVQFTASRGVDADGNIHIEGVGIVPDLRIPVDEETLFADYDVVLQAGIDYLSEVLGIN